MQYHVGLLFISRLTSQAIVPSSTQPEAVPTEILKMHEVSVSVSSSKSFAQLLLEDTQIDGSLQVSLDYFFF